MPHRLLAIADSSLAWGAGAVSTAIYLVGEAMQIPGLEYASFAGLLMLVLYWTQARITYLDKQYEDREKRQEATNAELQKFIHDKMHVTLTNLHGVIQRQCELTGEFRNELHALQATIHEMRQSCGRQT